MHQHLNIESPAVLVAVSLGCIYLLTRSIQAVLSARRLFLISRKHGCKPIPAYPHKDPIFGLDVFFESVQRLENGDFMESSRDRYQQMGVNTFTQLLLGERMIQTAEPENIKALLATQFKDFQLPARRKEALGPVFGHGIFTTDGAEWELSRSLLRPNFSRSQVGDLDTFEKHISKMIAKIPTDGSTVDLQRLFFMLTLDSATEFLFGQSTDVLGDSGASEAGERFADAFGNVTYKASLQTRVGKLATILPDRKRAEDTKFVHEYVADYVRTAVAMHAGSKEKSHGDASKYVFLEELAKTDYPAKRIQDELLNVLLAGRDTTAGLLSYLFYILARRPDVFEKLMLEVEQLRNGRPSYEEIKSMKYLQYCLNETLRLHPIVPANSRTAVRDTTLPVGGGADGKSPIVVKRGQSVTYEVYVMQRREDLYGKDALDFKPERWENMRSGWHYVPFNGGPRICIGQQFALTEASYTTIRLLQTFAKIVPREDTPLFEYLTLTSAVKGGVHVGLTPA